MTPSLRLAPKAVMMAALALTSAGCSSRMDAHLETRYDFEDLPIPEESGLSVKANRLKSADLFVILRNSGTKPIRVEWVSLSKNGEASLRTHSNKTVINLAKDQVAAFKVQPGSCLLPSQLFVKYRRGVAPSAWRLGGGFPGSATKRIAMSGNAEHLPDAIFNCDGS